MRKRIRWLLPIAILGVAILVTVVLVSGRPAPPKRETPPREPLVEVEAARTFAGEFLLSAQGTVMPRTETILVSEVNGAVVEVADNFNAGGFFRRGDVLMRIDAKDYQAAMRRAEAQVANRRALLAQEQARADQARKDWDNLRRPGAPSDLVLRVPYVAEAEANLRSAEADLQQARIQLDRTTIRAPFDGMLREKRVDQGQYVATGTPLALVFATDRAEIRLPLTEHDVAFVDLPAPGSNEEGAPLILRANVGGTMLSWQARLVRSEHVIDERSRVIHAVAAVDDPYGVLGRRDGPALPFGTYVEADIPSAIGHHVVSVPRHAVRGGNQLMVVDHENRLRLRTVVIARGDSQQAFIESGLEPGERVIVSSLDAPVDGMMVRVAGDEPVAAPTDDEAIAAPPVDEAAEAAAGAGSDVESDADTNVEGED